MFDYFIDAIILKRSAQFLFWNWTEPLLKETLNPTRARLWFARVQHQIEFKEWNTKFLGTSITKLVPIMKPECYPPQTWETPVNTLPEWVTSRNLEFTQYIGQLTRSKTINDESYQLLVHFSKCFHIVTIDPPAIPPLNPEPQSIFVIAKDEAELASSKFSFSFTQETPNSPTPIASSTLNGSLKDYHALTDEDKKYQNCLLTIKEVLNDYVDLRSHSVVITDDTWASKAVTYKMAEDVHLVLDHKNQKVISIEQHQTVYSATKTANSWQIIDDTTGVSIDYRDFQNYTIIEHPDTGFTEYFLRWAYTHILRKILNFNPQQWQLQYLLWEKKENYLAGCRRMGKTALAAYEIPRELLCMPNKQMFRNRPRKALFIAPTKDKYKEVLDYFMEYTSKIRELRNLVYNSKLDRITFEDQVIGVWRSKVCTPLAICDFGTSRWFEAGRGKAADWIGVEEAGYVSESVFDNVMPIVEGEGARLFCISTINADDTAQWFLRELTKAEERMRDPNPVISQHVFALRVTIDEIDERVMTRSQKESTKERALIRWYSYYYAELFATVPSKNSVFDTNGFFIPLLPSKPTSWVLIIAYDPAKRADYGAVTISGVIENKLVLFETIRWQGLDYHEQRDRFQQILTRFSGQQIYTVMDSTGVGEAVREIFRGMIRFHVWYSSRKQPAEIDQYGTWNVGKRDLVEMCQSLIESKQLVATMDQNVLADEMVAFTEFRTKQGSYSYSAKTWHDDVVNAMLLTSFVYWKILGNNRMWLSSDGKNQRSAMYKPKQSLSPSSRYWFK